MAKVTWATTRNRSLKIDFALDQHDMQWVQEMITQTTEELRQTAPNGRVFSVTVQVVLDQEKNWIHWKNELCMPFDRELKLTGKSGGSGRSRQRSVRGRG